MSKVITTCRTIAVTVTVLLLYGSQLFAQSKTLSRTYEPVVVDGELLAPLMGAAINDLTAFSYNAGTGLFTAIPFQIDEISADGKFLLENDGQVDGNDQLVFMPGDVGDRAATDKWVTDSPNDKRVELEVNDPLAASGKGWVYLFRGLASKPSVPSYLNYDRGASTTVGADTVTGLKYRAAHANSGWPNYLALPVGGAKNLIDRQKVRVKGEAVFLGVFKLPYETNEENGLKFVDVKFGGGAVRGLRELKVSLSAVSGTTVVPIDTVAFVTQYFPYSTSLGAKDANIDSATAEIAGVSLIRQSLDFSPNAVGMKFFNAYNTGGFTIDGVDDAPASTITSGGDVNWLMVTGDPGTVLLMLDVPAIGTARSLYYRDVTNAGPLPDGTVDTGDLNSYGDLGVMITGTKIRGQFSFDFTTYYLDPNQSVSTGDNFKQQYQNPLQVTAAEQTRTTTSVSDNRNRPANFVLDDAQPNPFWPLRGSVRLSFSAPQAVSAPTLRIYNLLGQEVAHFDFRAGQTAATRQHVLWDGRTTNGQLLPAGVYFFQLQAGVHMATKKLIIIR